VALVHAMQGRPARARRAYESARTAYEKLDQHRLLAFVLRDELTYAVLPYLSDHLAERERVASAAEQAVLRGNAAGAIDEPAEYARYPRVPLMVLEGEWREARRIKRAMKISGCPWLGPVTCDFRCKAALTSKCRYLHPAASAPRGEVLHGRLHRPPTRHPQDGLSTAALSDRMSTSLGPRTWQGKPPASLILVRHFRAWV